jgi:hypothetical protein
VHDETGWHSPVEASVNSDTLHDTFPHVVERAPGSFPDLDATPHQRLAVQPERGDDALDVVGRAQLDGARRRKGPSPGTIDVFPYLYPDHSNQHWSVMWVTENGTVEVPVDDVEGAIPVIVQIPTGGYTPRLAPTPTPGIYWAAWAEGSDPDQKIRQRFLMK